MIYFDLKHFIKQNQTTRLGREANFAILTSAKKHSVLFLTDSKRGSPELSCAQCN